MDEIRVTNRKIYTLRVKN